MAAAYDKRYFLNISGILKLCRLLFSVIGMLCVAFSSAPVGNLRGACYMAIAAVAFLCTALLFLARLYQLWPAKLCGSNAAKCEMYLHGVLAVALFLAAAAALTLDLLLYSVAAFFGFLAAGMCGFDAYLGNLVYRQSDASTQTI